MLKKLIIVGMLLPIVTFAGNNYFKTGQETAKLKGGTAHGIIEKEYHYVVEPKQHFYTKIAYPQIVAKKNAAKQDEFNQAVLNLVKTNQDEFAKNLQATTQMIKERGTKGMPPLSEQSNNLIIQYEITNAKNDLVSVRFTISSFNYGMAHPTTFTRVINYNANTHKVLELKDLFTPNSDYLKKIAQYSQADLTKRLTKKNAAANANKFELDMIAKGTAPESKNYSNWNIVPKGLLISFDPAQVAAAYFGRQEVLIPNNILQADFVKNLSKE